MPAVRRLSPVLAVGVVLLAACGSSASTPRAAAPPTAATAAPSTAATPALSGSLTVLAAASLTKTFTLLAKDFEAAHPGVTVTVSFGPSSGLAQQILAGAPADVFASASAKNMSQVVDAGAGGPAVTFATNAAEIAVAPGSAGRVKGLADLASGDVKVALCQPEVPCGALAQKVLAAAKVTVKPVTQGLDVKSTLAYVTSGQADAAIVYETDVLAAGSAVAGVRIPDGVNATTAYEIAPVKSSHNAALASAFDAFVLSPAGLDALRQAGFRAP